MAAISERFGSGGANLTPQNSAGSPSLATALRDIADDLADLTPAAISTPDASGTYGVNEQALLNELKATINALAAVVLRTTKV
ncbi:MAG: hypothetical protein MJE77_41390 [Proteobacteria bacterium]|nr:hypothetical protein [Pseudomonadota bacterium]